MTAATAAALARRLAETPDAATQAGIRAAMVAGGFDPDTTEPDAPEGYNDRAVSDARAWNPAYLSGRELSAMIEARTPYGSKLYPCGACGFHDCDLDCL